MCVLVCGTTLEDSQVCEEHNVQYVVQYKRFRIDYSVPLVCPLR